MSDQMRGGNLQDWSEAWSRVLAMVCCSSNVFVAKAFRLWNCARLWWVREHDWSKRMI